MITFMDFGKLRAVFRSQFSCSQRMILTVMLDAIGSNKSCFVSYETMAKFTGLCEKAVRLNVQDLEQDGAVLRLGKRGKCNVYSVTLKPFEGSSFDDDTGNGYRGQKDVSPVTGSKMPVTGSQDTGNHYQQTTYEPPINHNLTGSSSPKTHRRRKAGAEKKADPRFIPFRDSWNQTFEKKFGFKYQFKREDGVQLARFLRHESSMTLEEWNGFLNWIHSAIANKAEFTPGIIKHAAGSLATACSRFSQLLIHSQS